MQRRRPNPEKSVGLEKSSGEARLRDAEIESSLEILDRLETDIVVLRSIASIGLREMAEAERSDLIDKLTVEIKPSATSAPEAALYTEFENE